MASNYAADPSVFNDPISMLDAADVKSATQLRQILEALHDNTANLRKGLEGTESVLALIPRVLVASHSVTSSQHYMAAVCASADEGHSPVNLVKTGQVFVANDLTAVRVENALPSLTTVRGAAVDENGRLVVVGAATPYNVTNSGGGWANGGNQIGADAAGVIYHPGGTRFLAWRDLGSANIYRSADAASWSSAGTGLTAVHGAASIGGGGGAGRLLAHYQAGGAADVFALSTNHGVNWSLPGTAPLGVNSVDMSSIASCPMVSRLNLNRYVFYAGVVSNTIRIARTADGVTWETLATVTPPTNTTLQAAYLRICKSTGFMFLQGYSAAVQRFYFSRDGVNWTGPKTHPTPASGTAYAVAGGRLFRTVGAEFEGSDGVFAERFSL